MNAIPYSFEAIREQMDAAYSSGVLEPAMALLMETRIALSPLAARDAACADAICAAFFEAEEPSDMAPGALENVFARIASGEDPLRRPLGGEQKAAAAAGAGLRELLSLPDGVRQLAFDAMADHGWKFAGPGLRALPLPMPGQAKAEILRIEPGWGPPTHDHEGGEYTLVMTGAFRDEFGLYGIGEVCVGGPGLRHRPVAEPGDVCLCLAVTDAPLAFTGALGFLQKVLRH